MQSTPELIAACLSRAGVEALLVGGLAMEAHGYGRQTYDVDCLMAIDDVGAFEQALLGEGYARAPSGDNFRCYTAPSVYLAPVDVLMVEAETFRRMRQDGRAWRFGAVTLHVPSLPHLLALKLHAVRNNAAREARDLGDVAELLAANPGAISEVDLDTLCARYGPPGIRERLGRLRV